MAKDKKMLLKLYVNGMTNAARSALENLEQTCSEFHSKNEYSIEIIDIRQHPQLAEDEKIIATPTVFKKLPPPMRRIIGDMSDRDQLLFGLDLIESSLSD